MRVFLTDGWLQGFLSENHRSIIILPMRKNWFQMRRRASVRFPTENLQHYDCSDDYYVVQGLF
jgi:hypothetical protein